MTAPRSREIRSRWRAPGRPPPAAWRPHRGDDVLTQCGHSDASGIVGVPGRCGRGWGRRTDSICRLDRWGRSDNVLDDVPNGGFLDVAKDRCLEQMVIALDRGVRAGLGQQPERSRWQLIWCGTPDGTEIGGSAVEECRGTGALIRGGCRG